ncbi:MAG: RNA polymerase sigma-70 factor (ECF subfamily) [Pseudohongiellaceae bacterium]
MIAAQSGELPAVAELLVRHLPGLRAYIRLRAGALVRQRESASDLAQSVCREVLQNIDRFQYGGEAGFKHWLYATALRRIQKRQAYWKTLKRDVAREQAGADISVSAAYGRVSSPSQKVVGREDLERIERAFDELSEGEREIITLARLVGLSHDEIAEALGKSVGATRVQLHRALARLAIILDVGEEP